MKIWTLWLAVALGLAGCGDDASSVDSGVDGATLDGGADAAMTDGGDLDGGDFDASTDADVDAGAPTCAPRLLVVTSDYVTSEATLYDPVTGSSESLAALADADSLPFFAGCRSFLLERQLGHLLALDGVTTSLDVDLNAAGVTDPYASNPQMVLSISDTEVWVPLAGRNAIVRVDPTADAASAVLGEIGLSGYVDAADTDGLVEASDGVVVGDRAFIALGRYFFDSSYAIHFDAGSVLAVIDVATGTPIDMDDASDGLQGIPVGNNPWRGLAYDATGHRILVGAAGDSFAIDGAIEAVDLDSDVSVGALLTESTLGAELYGFAFVSDSRVLVQAGTDIVVWNLLTDAVDPTPITTGVAGMKLIDGTLYTWSTEGAGIGLHSFDATTGVETTPAAGPATFGTLPIAALASAP